MSSIEQKVIYTSAETRKIVDNELGIEVQELEYGRKKFEMDVGRLGKVEVLDIPANVITEDEWEVIDLARRSYRHMWGGIQTIHKIEEDPFDGRPPHDQEYLTSHQIASFISLDGRRKIVTNRKVTINPNREVMPRLYDDIEFWKVVDKQNGSQLSFWEVLSSNLESSIFSDHNLPPELQIAAISRTGVFPYTPYEKDEEDHDETAIAWAMMQIATTYQDEHVFFVCQLCEEFPEKVHNIMNPEDGVITKLEFTKTEDILGFSPQMRLRLDRSNPYVQAHLLEFPGYWLEGESLFRLLVSLVNRDKLSANDFISVSSSLHGSDEKNLLQNHSLALLERSLSEKDLSRVDLEDLLKLFTKPRFSKYLIPLINAEGNINPSLEAEELRQSILQVVDERPYSSTLIPVRWQGSAKNLLRVAKSKYNGNI